MRFYLALFKGSKRHFTAIEKKCGCSSGCFLLCYILVLFVLNELCYGILRELRSKKGVCESRTNRAESVFGSGHRVVVRVLTQLTRELSRALSGWWFGSLCLLVVFYLNREENIVCVCLRIFTIILRYFGSEDLST